MNDKTQKAIKRMRELAHVHCIEAIDQLLAENLQLEERIDNLEDQLVALREYYTERERD